MLRRNRIPAEPPGRGFWRQMVVRHRAPGHLRFDLPPALCSAAAVGRLKREVGALDGVWRVGVFPLSRKLSIRWTEEVCSLAEVARHLAAVVDGIAVPAPAPVPPPPGLVERIGRSRPVARLKARYADLKAKAELLSRIVAIKTGRQPPLPTEARDWVVAFVNDLVVFYLVRLHWQRITRQWLPNPWTFRYQWLAVVYLTFLLVRHRKRKRTDAEAEAPSPCCGAG